MDEKVQNLVTKNPSMFFRSNKVDAHWDTWVYFHEDTFYLYYLITEYSPGEGFGVATSKDGVTWTDYGWALKASEKMEVFLGTGAVWKAVDFKNSAKFICNYSEYRSKDTKKPQQNIFFAWSKDLLNMYKFGDEYMFKVDQDYYQVPGRWDCIFAIPRKDGGYFGYWSATPKCSTGFG